MSIKSEQNKYADIRLWVKIAVAEEDAKPSSRLWKGEPSKEIVNEEHQKRIRFLHRCRGNDPRAKSLAERLQSCPQREDVYQGHVRFADGCCNAGS